MAYQVFHTGMTISYRYDSMLIASPLSSPPTPASPLLSPSLLLSPISPHKSPLSPALPPLLSSLHPPPSALPGFPSPPPPLPSPLHPLPVPPSPALPLPRPLSPPPLWVSSSTQTFHGGQDWAHLSNFVEDFSVTTNGLGTPEAAVQAAYKAVRCRLFTTWYNPLPCGRVVRYG